MDCILKFYFKEVEKNFGYFLELDGKILSLKSCYIEFIEYGKSGLVFIWKFRFY